MHDFSVSKVYIFWEINYMICGKDKKEIKVNFSFFILIFDAYNLNLQNIQQIYI